MKENQNLEWKESWKDEYIKWICGFANAQGGTLFIGKDDKGTVTGVPGASKLMEDIPNKVRDILGIIIDVNLVKENDKEFLEIVVEPYPYPVSYKGQYHYRSGSTKQVLKGPALDKFLLKKQGKRWDGVPVPNVTVKDLKKDAFELFRVKAAKSGRLSKEILSENSQLLVENLRLKDGNYLKRAAVLLFHPDPEAFFPGAYIKIGFFQSEADLIYQDEIHGNLFEQSEKAMDLLLTKYLKAYISYEGITRVERFLFPREALREALLNAIVHKDYGSGIPIQIKVHENKIILWNQGELPENWTIERLKQKHPSNPYNPDIANAFFRAGLIESWGRGIEKIDTECRKHGIPAPEYNYWPSSFMLEMDATEMLNSVYKQSLPGNRGKESGKKGGQQRWSVKVVSKGGQKLTNKQQELFDILIRTPSISRKELSRLLEINESAVQKRLETLKKKGILEREGAAKNGSWKIIGE
ncbi:MAG: winged helix-turn-helix transcriptional regulator [bacterium]|nr:winged helix-turn-helix transcriptional regulator [bacterium]